MGGCGWGGCGWDDESLLLDKRASVAWVVRSTLRSTLEWTTNGLGRRFASVVSGHSSVDDSPCARLLEDLSIARDTHPWWALRTNPLLRLG